ncbi:MAG: hypothetical protein L3J43_09585 [Sulfurovum sp.]|nr:hypothetical protein [Sulfurovum sp.]
MKNKVKLFKKANQAWKAGKTTKSFKYYKKCAKMGHTPCYFSLGYMYDDGMGTEIDKIKALYWYKKADKSGIHCHDNIANIYAQKPFNNRAKEKQWLKKGIQRKDTSTMYNMAIFYREENRMKKMQKWFKKSYMYNDGSAAFELAKIYLSKAKIDKGMKYLEIVHNHDNVTLYEREKSEEYLKKLRKEVVYSVQHSYTFKGCEEIKDIGIFSTKKKAKNAIKKLKSQKGFKKYKKGFTCGPQLMNQIYWDGGFFTYQNEK